MRYILMAICLLLAPPALADTDWPLEDVSLTGQGEAVSRFIYVPPGQRFESVQLHIELPEGMDRQRLAVALNDRRLHSLEWRLGDKRTLSLPDLYPGFHRLELTGWPAPLALGEPEDHCPVLMTLPLTLSAPTLRYRAVAAGEMRLSDLPDALFNPSHPRRPVGILELDRPEALTAAARLISGWQFARRVEWRVGASSGGDFAVRLRQDSALDADARITLHPLVSVNEAPARPRPPALEIRYRDRAGLEAAVHRLLDESQRQQLTGPRADIRGPSREPGWAVLKEPRTLADLGFEDLHLDGSQQRSLALPFPPHWQPTGALSGSLRLRGQAGLPEGSRLDVWVNEVLSGSQPTHDLASHDIQRSIPVDGSRKPRSAALGMRLSAELDVPRHCTWPLQGSLWLDAEQSRLELPHQAKSGVMALVPRLLADPGVILDESQPEAAMQLLTGMMELTRLASTPHPLPYRIELGRLAERESETAPSLALLIDEGLQERLLARYPDRVAAEFVAGALRWQADADGRSLVTAASAETMRQAAARIGDMGYRLPDGARDVLIHAREGIMVVLDEQPRVATAPARPLSRQQLEWGVLAVAGLVALLLAGLLWRFWRRSRSRRAA